MSRGRARGRESTPATRRYGGADPIGFVISENVRRRHLTTGQLAAVAAEAETLYAAEAKAAEARRKRATGGPAAAKATKGAKGTGTSADRQQSPPEKSGSPNQRKASAKAAKTTGTSGRSVARFKRLQEQAPDLAAKVKAGTMPLDRADRILRDREAERKRIEKDAAKAKAWDLWLDCHDAPDVAVALRMISADAKSADRNSQANTVRTWINEKRKSAEFVDPPASRQHFDVWQFHIADGNAGQQSYFGALPPRKPSDRRGPSRGRDAPAGGR